MKNGKRRKIVERGGEKAKIGEVKISLSLYLRREERRESRGEKE